jgi:hypothetical protein
MAISRLTIGLLYVNLACMHDMLRKATISGFFENLASHLFRRKPLIHNILCQLLPELPRKRQFDLTLCLQIVYTVFWYVACSAKTRHFDPVLARFTPILLPNRLRERHGQRLSGTGERGELRPLS